MNGPGLSTMWQAAVGLGRKEFLVLPDRRFTYRDLATTIRAFCSVFERHGLKPGDRVVVCTENEYCVSSVFIAAVLHGIVPVVLGAATRAPRGTAVITDTEAKLLIADPAVGEAWKVSLPVEEVLKEDRRPRAFFGRDRGVWPLVTASGGESEPACPARTDALAYLLYTSGSTADPSGVELTLGNLLANLESVGRITDLRRGDRMFNDSPMAHTDGLIHGPMLAFAHGACVVRAGGFRLSRMEEWLNTVSREGCTQIIATPFIWSSVCRYSEHEDYFSGPEMRLLISSAARLSPRLWAEVEDRFGKPLANEYGMTETVMAAFHAGPVKGMGAKGTIGLPAHCEARIDESMSDDAGCGELLLRGAPISPGYWKNPSRTKATRTGDGWFRTGDLARQRPDGSYELVGRIGSIINSAGVRIHPDEVNEALEAHAGVRAAVTVGLPDDDFGEIAVSAVEVDDDLTELDLVEHARARLEPAKVPKRIVVLPEIPRTESGKPKLAETSGLLTDSIREPVPETSPDTFEAKVLAAAAATFRCDEAELALSSTQDDVVGWDSFSELQLILSLEKDLGIRLPTRRLTIMRTLGDLVQAIREAT